MKYKPDKQAGTMTASALDGTLPYGAIRTDAETIAGALESRSSG